MAPWFQYKVLERRADKVLPDVQLQSQNYTKISQFVSSKCNTVEADTGMCKAQFPVDKQSSKIACVKENETISFDQNKDFD